MFARPEVAASGTVDAPATAGDLVAALETWQTTLKPLHRGRNPISLSHIGESVTVTANLEALRHRKAALELVADWLLLRLQTGERRIPLWFFETSARAGRGSLTFTFALRSTPAVRESIHRSFEPANRELWPGVLRMLNTAGSTPLHAALVARLLKAVADVAEDVEERLAAEAVSESSDPLTLVRLLEQPQMLDELRAVAPLAPARLRGIAARKRLIELAGGALSADEAAEALGLTRQAVDKRRRGGKLLALSAGKRGYRYPAFQFVSGGVLPGLERVLGTLSHHDAWMRLSFLVNRSSDLNDESPIAVLKKGDIEAVLLAAAAFGEHGAA